MKKKWFAKILLGAQAVAGILAVSGKPTAAAIGAVVTGVLQSVTPSILPSEAEQKIQPRDYSTYDRN